MKIMTEKALTKYFKVAIAVALSTTALLSLSATESLFSQNSNTIVAAKKTKHKKSFKLKYMKGSYKYNLNTGKLNIHKSKYGFTGNSARVYTINNLPSAAVTPKFAKRHPGFGIPYLLSGVGGEFENDGYMSLLLANDVNTPYKLVKVLSDGYVTFNNRTDAFFRLKAHPLILSNKNLGSFSGQVNKVYAAQDSNGIHLSDTKGRQSDDLDYSKYNYISDNSGQPLKIKTSFKYMDDKSFNQTFLSNQGQPAYSAVRVFASKSPKGFNLELPAIQKITKTTGITWKDMPRPGECDVSFTVDKGDKSITLSLDRFGGSNNTFVPGKYTFTGYYWSGVDKKNSPDGRHDPWKAFSFNLSVTKGKTDW